MSIALIRRLENFASIPVPDAEKLMNLAQASSPLRSGEDLIREGQVCGSVLVVLQGIAGRYKLLPSGQRQITGYMLPGDLIGWGDNHAEGALWSVGTLSRCLVTQIRRDEIAGLRARCPAVSLALRRMAISEEATLNEWVVNVGRRSAYQRIAHLFCELLLRFRAIGLTQGNGFDFPLTQQDIGDTTAMSVVHVNRVLQALRSDGLIMWERRRLDVLDEDRLRAAAMFKPDYLRLVEGRTRPRRDNAEGASACLTP